MKLPRFKRQRTAESARVRPDDPAAVAICAHAAGVDLRRAAVATMAAERYWLAALRLDDSPELEPRRAELAAVRREHSDLFGQAEPSARKCEVYLQRIARLTQDEARQFVGAHSACILEAAEGNEFGFGSSICGLARGFEAWAARAQGGVP